MKIKIIIVFILISSINIYAQGGSDRFIKVEYQHSLRIPYNKIELLLEMSEQKYIMYITTKQMDGKTGYEDTNIEKTIIIDQMYFDEAYKKLLDINLKEMLLSNEGIVGADGSTILVAFGTQFNNITLNLWSPFYKTNERKMETIVAIIKDLFNKAGLEEWL
ncbi:MAG: hypothetical protein LBM77_11265 [Spirochaetaceae bacterium]|jgi:hypothetical protein|nr:hypothetical protein [Spirochaetaceae bacterium]